MSVRKYAGVGLGFVFSLLFAATAMANTIGPNIIGNKSPGWNSEIFQDNTQNTDYFWIQQCSSSSSTAKFDLMHHWFGLPSTGTAERSLTCVNTQSWKQASWANAATADYSIEYTHNTVATVSLWYQIQY